MIHLHDIICDQCDPDEFIDRLGLDTSDLVRAFSTRIDLAPEVFEDLMREEDFAEGEDVLEAHDKDRALEDTLTIIQEAVKYD